MSIGFYIDQLMESEFLKDKFTKVPKKVENKSKSIESTKFDDDIGKYYL